MQNIIIKDMEYNEYSKLNYYKKGCSPQKYIKIKGVEYRMSYAPFSKKAIFIKI